MIPPLPLVPLLDAAHAGDKSVFLAAQKNAKTNNPQPTDTFLVGTIATIVDLVHAADGTVQTHVRAERRAKASQYSDDGGFPLADVEELLETPATGSAIEALMGTVRGLTETYVALIDQASPEDGGKLDAEEKRALSAVRSVVDPSALGDIVAGHLPTLKLAARQELLETADVARRLERLRALMEVELGVFRVQLQVRERAVAQTAKNKQSYDEARDAERAEQMARMEQRHDALEGRIDQLEKAQKELEARLRGQKDGLH